MLFSNTFCTISFYVYFQDSCQGFGVYYLNGAGHYNENPPAMSGCLASISHRSTKGEYAPASSKLSFSLSTSSFSIPSADLPVFQVEKSNQPENTEAPGVKTGSERKKLSDFTKFQETDLMMRQFRRQRNKPLSVKQKKRECRAVAAEVKNFFSDGRTLKPVPQRIFSGSPKVEKQNVFLCRPPITRAEKLMKNFQKGVKVEEPCEVDKVKICASIAGAIKEFFMTNPRLRQVVERIDPDPEKVERLRSFFFRPPLSQEQKNLECWRNMGPSKIKLRKRVCQKIAVNVQSYFFRKEMVCFQQQVKHGEPSEDDKIRISSFIAGEVMGFFKTHRSLRRIVKVTRRIYPDPEKVERLRSFFFRPPLSQEQKNLECWRNMGPSKIKLRKRVCQKIAVNVQSYFFRKEMVCFQQQVKHGEPSEDDKIRISSLIAGEVMGFFKTHRSLRHIVKVTRRIYPDPEKVERLRSFFFRPPLSQEQKNLECWRNMGPSKIKLRKRVCQKIAVNVQSYFFRKEMVCLQQQVKHGEPSEDDKIRISSFIAGEVMGFFKTHRSLRRIVKVTRRIYPDPEKVERLRSFFFRPPLSQEQKNLECWRNMGPSKIKLRKRVCQKIAVSVQSYFFRKEMVCFQQQVKHGEPSEDDKIRISSFIAGEVMGFFKTHRSLRCIVKVTRRIYPDPEKLAKVASFFCRETDGDVSSSVFPLSMDYQKSVCRRMANAIRCYFFGLLFIRFEKRVTNMESQQGEETYEDVLYYCWKNRKILHPTIKVLACI